MGTPRTADRNANWRGGPASHTCDHCGNHFSDTPGRKRRFCSRTCSSEHLRGTHSVTLSERCKERDARRTPEQIAWRNAILLANAAKKRVPRETYLCSWCGLPFERYIPPSRRTDRRFCSPRCVAVSNSGSGAKNSNWRDGVSFEPYPVLFNGALKRFVRERDRVCMRCGITPQRAGEALCVHHVDYSKDNLEPFNLIALCRPCHVSTNGRREYWTAFFRRLLHERYGYPVPVGGQALAVCERHQASLPSAGPGSKPGPAVRCS